MSGLKRNSLSAAILLIAAGAHAHTPLPGQIVRHQPNNLRQQRPFTLKGVATAAHGQKMSTLMDWTGPGQYQVTLSSVPKSFYASEVGSSSWTLVRHGKICVLKNESMSVACPAAALWTALSLMGQPEGAAQTLVDAGFLSATEAAYSETDSRIPLTDATHRVKLAVMMNGAKPMAALEIHPPSEAGAAAPSETEGPVVRFDQTFLAPIFARFNADGDSVTIQFISDFDTAKGKTRGSALLAGRVDVTLGKNDITKFLREEPSVAKKSIKPAIVKTITGLSTFKDQLSLEGQTFLRAFLLVH